MSTNKKPKLNWLRRNRFRFVWEAPYDEFMLTILRTSPAWSETGRYAYTVTVTQDGRYIWRGTFESQKDAKYIAASRIRDIATMVREGREKDIR